MQDMDIVDGISRKEEIVGYIGGFCGAGVGVGIVGFLWGIWVFYGVVFFGERKEKVKGT